MQKSILSKVFYQLIFAGVFTVIYMQIRPVEAYTVTWPIAFLGGWFLLMAWMSYLHYDKLSIYTILDEHKKDKERREQKTKFKMKQMMDFINTPVIIDPNLTEKQRLQVKIISNGITSIILFILAAVL